MTERHLPDKAIDALDEAGSRVHLTNIEVAKHIIDLEADPEDIKEKKFSCQKSKIRGGRQLKEIKRKF